MYMKDRKSTSILENFDFVIVDTIAIIVSFSISYLIKFKSLNFLSKYSFKIVILSLIIINLILVFLTNPYEKILKRGRTIELRKIIIFSMNNLILLSLVLFILKIGQNVSREVIISTYIYFVFVSFIFRSLWKKYKRINNDFKKNLLIVSYSNNIKDIIHNILNSDIQEYNISGLCLIDDSSIDSIDNIKVVCNVDNIYEYISSNSIDEMFIAAQSNILSEEVVRKILNMDIDVNLSISHIYGLEPNNANTNKVGIYNTFDLGSFKFSDRQYVYMNIKRIFDIIISIFGLIVLFISMIVVKIMNLINKDNGPLFYSQIRVGKNGKLFKLIKFRSMRVNAQNELDDLLKNDTYKLEWEDHQKIDDDPRITKVGKLLRKSSLDEIPQVLNILKGDMSLIGPRPLIPGELEAHNGIKLYEQVKPGMTSWWACNGRSNINYDERLEFEYYYVKNISFLFDISCLLKTILIIFKKTGAK